MRRAALVLTLLVLLASLFLLSVLSNFLTGYPANISAPDSLKEKTTVDIEEEPEILLFKVSPATPQLFWRIWSADYYTGQNWLRTTDEKILEDFPQIHDHDATTVFTVEIIRSQREIFLPLASANSTLANISILPTDGIELYADPIGNICKAVIQSQAKKDPLTYEVSWHSIEKIDDRLISLNSTAEEILDRYLQLPDIPPETWKLAKDLENPSYSVLDQILADVNFLRTNFVYDAHTKYLYDRVTRGSDVSSYLERRRGVCIDASTALAIILRIQKIPARISIGYKPKKMEGDKLLYYTTETHSVTEVYLPPYGWIQFDATPPLEHNPIAEVKPFKRESSPGSRLVCQLTVTNRRNQTDDFKLSVNSKQKWHIEAAPEEIRVEALQTADALLEVTVPVDAELGEKDVVTVNVASLRSSGVEFFTWAIVQVGDVFHIPTATTLGYVEEAATRGKRLWVNGTVHTASDEGVDNMPILVFLTKSTEAKGVIIGKGYSKQGNFQIEGMIPNFMEIGDYEVIPVSLGTARYAPSSTHSLTRVRAETIMEFGSEERFLLEYGAIHGRLLWDNGTSLSNASISLEITLLATQSDVWKSQNLTSDDGTFRIETQFENPGVYQVEAWFIGNQYVLGSSATRVVELKHGLPAIQIRGENCATRGKVFNITGMIGFEDVGIWGESLTVAFDNQLLTTVETRDNGSYEWSFLVDPEESLGPHFFIVNHEKSNVSAVHQVMVKSKTALAAKVSHVAGGMFLLFSASLSDDHHQPIQGAEITVEHYHLSGKTNENGNISFLLDTVSLWPMNLMLNAKFEGSELHLPATTEKEIFLEQVISLPFLISLVSPPIIAMVFVYAKHQIERRQASQQTPDMKVAREEAMIGEKSVHKPRKMGPLRIILPDIKAQLPNVWSINEKLCIELALDKTLLEKKQKREVEVLIDEEEVATVRLSKHGSAKLSHVFNEKGEHTVRAVLPRTGRQPWKAEVKLRVVEYGEEVIRLYKEFSKRLADYGVQARDEMTAREIESLILKLGDFGPESLHKVTTCFEKVEYSNRLATRKDYEIMYLSLRELNVHVE